MNSDPKINLAEQITAEACAWVAQLETGNLSIADISALKEWVSRSPAHAAEIKSVAQLSGQMGELTEHLQYIDQARRQRAIVRRVTHRPRLVTTFAALTIVAGVLAYSTGFRSEAPVEISKFATLTGEYETQTLMDGTIVQLNTNTQLVVEYSNASRNVNLLYGEALFDVSSDPTRPFVVKAGNSQSEALGTSFSVSLLGDVAELSVLEGVVAFSQNLNDVARSTVNPATSRLVLNAGQSIALQTSATVDRPIDAAQIRTVSERELLRRLSWTEGFLEFSDTPLQEVVDEVNRHIQSPLRIGDDRLNDVRIGGIYRTGDQSAMLEAFERLGIDVDRTDPAGIVLKLNEDAEDSL